MVYGMQAELEGWRGAFGAVKRVRAGAGRTQIHCTEHANVRCVATVGGGYSQQQSSVSPPLT